MAYPRPVIYDTVYNADHGLPASFAVNAAATVLEKESETQAGESGARWIDIVYPAYGATVYCTFTPVADSGERTSAVENRMERMSLNLGDNIGERTEIQSIGGYQTILLTTLGRTLTPVQFLSTGEKWVISGAMQFADPNVRADSVMPMIEAVAADIIHTARILK